jgi:hypothetical protein
VSLPQSVSAPIPVRLFRIDAISLLLERGEIEAANALFASDLVLERLPIGATCLRAVMVCPPELEDALDGGGTSLAVSIRRALERAMPRGYVLLALEVTTRQPGGPPHPRARVAA